MWKGFKFGLKLSEIYLQKHEKMPINVFIKTCDCYEEGGRHFFRYPPGGAHMYKGGEEILRFGRQVFWYCRPIFHCKVPNVEVPEMGDTIGICIIHQYFCLRYQVSVSVAMNLMS